VSYLAGLAVVAVVALCGTVLWGGVRTLAGAPLGRAAAEAVFVGYVLALAAVVILPFGRVGGPDGQTAVSFNLVPFATIIGLVSGLPRQVIRQLGGNTVMFVPLGFLLPQLFMRLRTPLALAATALAVSCGVEVAQLALRFMSLSGRSLDVDDVILNVAGALIGYGVWWVAARMAGPESSMADGLVGEDTP